MTIQFTYAKMQLYINDDGEFVGRVCDSRDEEEIEEEGEYYLGDICPDKPMDLTEFFRWVAEDAPDEKFPSVLVESDIEEIRDMMDSYV